MNEHLLEPRKPTHEGALGLLERAIPLLQLLGDYIGNGPIDASRADSLGVRCDLLGDIHEMLERHQRWTRNGRCLLLDGKLAIYVDREDTDGTAVLSPVETDALVDLFCRVLNTIDLVKLRAEWMAKP